MAPWKLELPTPLSPGVRYGLTVVSVGLALAAALALNHFQFRDAGVPLFLFAVALSAWYGRTGGAVLSLILSTLAFDYFFVEPLYSLAVSASELPYFAVFASFAALVAWFSAVRRRVEAELRQARDRLQIEVVERTRQASLLDLTHDTIFVRNMDGVITYWNRGAQELFGWTPAQAVGREAHELMQTVFPAPLEDIRAELLRTGRWDGELEKTRSDGSKVTVASRWSLGRDSRQQPNAILETNNDITDRLRREREIRTLNEELARRSSALESSNRELEAFAYTISHDLRAPLRHMSGFTELLQKSNADALNDKGRRYLGMIMESARRMGSLIDDLLAFSRIGRTETHKTPVRLDQLAAEVITEVRQDAAGRNIVWKAGPLPAAYGDRAMLRLVILNLLANAVKFTRTRPQAEIEIGCTEQKEDQVVLFVRDNGVGFDMKYVNKLFGVFQRLHRAEEFEGTGIGLATVQRIVHRHGGRIWAESKVDHGATFYFSLSNRKDL